MSLIDPSTRWWNRPGLRVAAAVVCWTLSIGGTLVAAWTMWLGERVPVPQGVSIALFVAGIPLLLAGSFLHQFASGRNDASSAVIFVPLSLYFVALGIGSGIGQWQSTAVVPWMSVVFVVGGIGVIVGSLLLAPVFRRNAEIRTRVERYGVKTTGVVTRATEYFRNHHPVTRVTVRFTDRSGATRWASDSISGSAPVGSQVPVRYSPPDLDHQAGVLIGR